MMPWVADQPLAPEEFAQVRLRTVFDCYKWDAQIGDIDMLMPFPILLDQSTWNELACLAEKLSREVVAAEEELTARPDLHHYLGLPHSIRQLLKRAPTRPTHHQALRLIRFDFHLTDEGWKISEANTDVPGGFNEAAGFSQLMARHYPSAMLAGDPAESLAEALAARLAPGSSVAMVHATSYTDDRQVMMFLAKSMEQRGLKTSLVSPEHVSWNKRKAHFNCPWQDGPIGAIVRFFPAEWLAKLDSLSAEYFFGAETILCNPATALLTQSKRFPLTWDFLNTNLETWRLLLPMTRDPRTVPMNEIDDWVFKPAWGREGDSISIPGVTLPKEQDEIRRAATKQPDQWIAQRRFKAMPLQTQEQEFFPCFGVYTIDGKAAGIYGRMGVRPIIDGEARDVAVLVRKDEMRISHGS